MGVCVRMGMCSDRRAAVHVARLRVDRHVTIAGMRMDWPFRAAKEPARLVRGQIGDDVVARHEFVADPFEAMCFITEAMTLWSTVSGTNTRVP